MPFRTFALAVRRYLEEDLATDHARVESLFADDFEACLKAAVDTNRDTWVSGWVASELALAVAVLGGTP